MDTWIAELDTGRFGDWVIVEAANEDQALKAVRRRTRRPIRSLRISLSREQWAERHPWRKGRKRRA